MKLPLRAQKLFTDTLGFRVSSLAYATTIILSHLAAEEESAATFKFWTTVDALAVSPLFFCIVVVF